MQDETDMINGCVRKMACRHKLLSEYLTQQKPDGEEQMEPSAEDEPLQGMYHLHTENMADVRKIYQWLDRLD